jgi:uncharacterized protein (DUF608 family)
MSAANLDVKTDSQSKTVYEGTRNRNIVYPLGGIGAGMIGLEGTGALSNISLRHSPNLNHEPVVFSAVCIKGKENHTARVLEGPIPSWKIFRNRADTHGNGNGLAGKTYGLPRFGQSAFRARFPFGEVELRDAKLPIRVTVCGWSPFIPLNADDSSLPVAALEYTFHNVADQPLELIYSFHSANFMAVPDNGGSQRIREAKNGFVLFQPQVGARHWDQGAFCVVTDQPQTVVDHGWFRGGWFDPLTVVWNTIESGICKANPPIAEGEPSPGASLYVPLALAANESKTIRVLFAWHVPESNVRAGVPKESNKENSDGGSETDVPAYHKPWYAGVFADVHAVAGYWVREYDRLRRESERFTDTLYAAEMPAEVIEAVTANLCILKSPTVLRQHDGRLWGWEGCFDAGGCCHGTCTHVWNYAQALPHLFPELERGLRETEFNEGQDEQGHQNFRIPLPIQPADHNFHAASDGQLGGIMKMYREWRISGDTEWLRGLWPKVKASLRYCIETWDPDRIGVLIEPHHNTYDIEFWGPDGMCTSVYLGALRAAERMAEALGEPETAKEYRELYERGREYMENELFNGEYFEQKIVWEGLRAPSPLDIKTIHTNYSPEALEILKADGRLQQIP